MSQFETFVRVQIREIIAEASTIPDGQNDLRKLQLRELALLNGTLRPEDLVSGARCSNCGSEEHKTWECPEQLNVTHRIICTACGGQSTALGAEIMRVNRAEGDCSIPSQAPLDESSCLLKACQRKKVSETTMKHFEIYEVFPDVRKLLLIIQVCQQEIGKFVEFFIGKALCSLHLFF